MVDWFMQKDKRIKYIRKEKSGGAGNARNNGNLFAEADIICVCDDDDCYTPDRAEKTLKFFADNPDVDIVTGSYIRISYNNEQVGIYDAEEFDIEEFKKSGAINYFSHPACAYKTKEILEHPYQEDISSGKEGITKTDDLMLVEDFVARDKKFGIIKEPICLHRVTPGGIMAKIRGGSLE
jgi:glycosyltransferase involved in cell wall biosynthesis